MLELRTKPPDPTEADDGTGEGGEGEVDVGAALVADRQMPEPGEPGEGALDHPAMSSKARAALDPATGDARGDAAGAALTTAAAVVVGLSAWSLTGLRRSRPRCLARTPGTASRVGASMRLSWRLAPLSVRLSGMPRASVTKWRLVPGLPRSVGFGPTSAPPFLHPGCCCRALPGSSPGPPRLAGAPAAPGIAPARPQPRATRPASARRSCRGSPVRSAPRATGCPSAARTRCLSAPPVRRTRPTAFRLRQMPRQQRFHHRPEVVRNE